MFALGEKNVGKNRLSTQNGLLEKLGANQYIHMPRQNRKLLMQAALRPKLR